MILYHGSTFLFDKFKNRIGKTFSGLKSEIPIFLSPTKDFAKIHARPNGYIYTVNIIKNNIFSSELLYLEDSKYWPPAWDDLTELGKRLVDDLDNSKIFGNHTYDNEIFKSILREDYDIMETKEIMNWVRDNEFDGFHVSGDGERNIAIFDASNIEILEVEQISKTAQLKQNYDYSGNFIDKVKRKNKRKNRIRKLSKVFEKSNVHSFKSKEEDLSFSLDEKNLSHKYKSYEDRYNKHNILSGFIPFDGVKKILENFPYFAEDSFLDKNSHILALAGLTKMIGSGMFGVAFLTDDGTVFKIFPLKKDYLQYLDIYNKQFSGQSNIYEPKIYNVGVFDTAELTSNYYKNNPPFLAYVEMEHLERKKVFSDDYIDIKKEEMPLYFLNKKKSTLSIGDIISDLITNIDIMTYNSFNKSKEKMENKKNSVILNIIKLHAHEIYNQLIKSEYYVNIYLINKISEILNISEKWFENLIISMLFNRFKSQEDLHSGNVGFRNDVPVYFDS